MTSSVWAHAAGLVVVGWLLGLGHGALSAIIPSLRLDVLLLVGTALALAAIIKGFGSLAFEEDRPRPLPLFGLLLGAFALWGSWCGWVWAATEFDQFLILHPIDLMQTVWGVANHGEYTTSGHGSTVAVAQPSVKWAWICEAVIISLGPALSAVFWVFERRDTWTSGW